MLKGLVITPPVVGRISIGRVVERNGKRLPEKDDQFTLTTQVSVHAYCDAGAAAPEDAADCIQGFWRESQSERFVDRFLR